MTQHRLEDVVARQKQHLFRDLLAIAVLVLGLTLAIFSLVGELPSLGVARPGAQVTPADTSPTTITMRYIDDSLHYL